MAKQLTFKLLLLLLFAAPAFAQNTFSISGTVKDKQGTIPGAAIYVSGYKTATISNDDGKFVLPNLVPGNYDILVQMIGYLPYKVNVVISDKSASLVVELTENATMLNEVVVRPDPDRAYHLALFKDYFIGKSPNAEDCKIINTNVLNTKFDKINSVLTVSANEFLIIENKALGYRIKYMLDFFEYNFKSRIIFYAGSTAFEEIKGSTAKQKKWKKAREVAYNGSIQHFFKSLYQNNTAAEGFLIHKLSKVPNPFRKPDSLINANIKRLTAGQAGLTRTLTFNGSDSLSYWLKQRNEPKLVNTINKADVLTDTLAKPYTDQALKSLNYSDALYIIYKNENETEQYRNSGNWQARPLDVPNYQISVVHLLAAPAVIYPNGAIFDPRSFLYEGYWAYEKVADLLPMDYIPLSKSPDKK